MNAAAARSHGEHDQHRRVPRHQNPRVRPRNTVTPSVVFLLRSGNPAGPYQNIEYSFGEPDRSRVPRSRRPASRRRPGPPWPHRVEQRNDTRQVRPDRRRGAARGTPGPPCRVARERPHVRPLRADQPRTVVGRFGRGGRDLARGGGSDRGDRQAMRRAGASTPARRDARRGRPLGTVPEAPVAASSLRVVHPRDVGPLVVGVRLRGIGVGGARRCDGGRRHRPGSASRTVGCPGAVAAATSTASPGSPRRQRAHGGGQNVAVRPNSAGSTASTVSAEEWLNGSGQWPSEVTGTG